MTDLDDPRAAATAREFVPLPRAFFDPSAAVVAPALLGHWLIHRTPTGPCGGVIVETEAYLVDDPASHGFKRATARNQAMYGPPGHAYVYFIYGNHWCFNAVCQPSGTAEAVLVRAVEPVWGLPILRRNRPVLKMTDLTSGPAKLCQAMAIDRRFDGVDLCQPAGPLLLARNPDADAFRAHQGPVRTSPRIGITVAAHWPLRFCLPGSAFVSRRLPDACSQPG